MKALGASAKAPGRVFLAGGASVLLGWRSSTIDVDLKIIPDSDEILRSLPALKERLEMNVELASPDDFIPALPGWQDRSRFIAEEGRLVFLHYDFYAQARQDRAESCAGSQRRAGDARTSARRAGEVARSFQSD
jgi:hypothetical protein